MTTAIASPAPTESRPPTMPFSEPWLTNLRRGLGRVGTIPTLMSGFGLSRAQKAEIESRLSTYRRQITGGSEQRPAIGASLAKLLAAFPTQDPGLTATMRVQAYSDAIEDAPAWAVEEARLQFVQGKVGDHNGNFAPTPPHFARVVRAILKPYQAEMHDLAALAMVEPYDPPSAEERARVGKRMDELAASLQPAVEDRHAGAVNGLEQRAKELGLPENILDTLPDAPARSGTIRKAG